MTQEDLPCLASLLSTNPELPGQVYYMATYLVADRATRIDGRGIPIATHYIILERRRIEALLAVRKESSMCMLSNALIDLLDHRHQAKCFFSYWDTNERTYEDCVAQGTRQSLRNEINSCSDIHPTNE
ncbi:MAG: hypothetical protein Greene041662_446 [Candidatus Peregrinibacteria bacterium Greene0416_62]|nr:MAG: hypothetical protein Greene041662_446 [Candidatus Peregrinibacteria bacterium Greene0416_62]TSC99116.1 MAG: hypothetical protein Greene101449_738 [Candidatus Peregrinibacteria bacterium Greene1014_49]